MADTTPNLALHIRGPVAYENAGNGSSPSQSDFDVNMEIIDAAVGNISYPVTSVASKTGAVTLDEADITGLVADLAGKQVALGFTPENLANKNQASGYAGLAPNGVLNTTLLPHLMLAGITGVKVYNSWTKSSATSGNVDFYTVPVGKRAVWMNTFFINTGTSTGSLLPQVKVGGNYYRLTSAVVQPNANNFLTVGPGSLKYYVAEAGELLSVQVTVSPAGSWAIRPLILEFDATSYVKSVKLINQPFGDSLLYTVPVGKRAAMYNLWNENNVSSLFDGAAISNQTGNGAFVNYLSIINSGLTRKVITSITNLSLTTNVLTVTAGNSFVAGDFVMFAGITNALYTFLNGKIYNVTGGDGSTFFTVSLVNANVASTANPGGGAFNAEGFLISASPGNNFVQSLSFTYVDFEAGDTVYSYLTVGSLTGLLLWMNIFEFPA